MRNALKKTDSSALMAEKILNNIRADIYVSDIDTHELLYCNRALRRSSNLGSRELQGEKCWAAIYRFDAPCSDCGAEEIMGCAREPYRTSIVEEKPGRFSEHHDLIIDWRQGRKVHLRCSLDVTARESAYKEYRKKSLCGGIVSDIAVQLISSENPSAIIDEILKRLGLYFAADQVLLLGIHELSRTYGNAWEYVREGAVSFKKRARRQRVPVSNHIYYQLLEGRNIVERCLSKSAHKKHFYGSRLLEADNLILTPVFVKERLWGILWVSNCADPVRWDENDFELCRQAAMTMAIAIERRNIELELLTAKETLQTILDNVPVAISWRDRDMRLLGSNRPYQMLFHADEENLSENILDDIEAQTFVDVPELLEQAQPGSRLAPEPSLCRIRDRLGNERWIRSERIPVRNEHGLFSILLGVTEDVTTEVQFEAVRAAQDAENRRMAELAVEQNRAKTNFLSHMSHEIRTPLNAIFGMYQVAAESEDRELTAYCLQRIGGATKVLLSIVNDALDISKIEADKMEVRDEAFEFEEMLRDVYGVVGVEAEQKEIHLFAGVDAKIPDVLRGDSRHISKILINLLANAIKFTPRCGVVDIIITVQEETDADVQISYDVSDTGIGLTPEQSRQLFEPFAQGAPDISDKYGGTGLGLNIAQRMANLMRSEIRVESEAGQGSTFSFSTRLQKVSDSDKNRATRPLEGVRVLIAGSSHTTMLSFVGFLEAKGAVIIMAHSISRTVEILEESDDIDVVVIDFALSEYDECEAMTAICGKHRTERMLLVTSGPEILEKKALAKELGIEHIIVRPLLNGDVVRTVCRAIGIMEITDGIAAQPDRRSFDFGGKRILLVEDIHLNREIVKHFLKKTGIEIEEADCGDIALKKYKSAPEKYDLILMDLKLPVMDGYDTAIAIRAFESGIERRVPILALTSSAFESDRRRSVEAGMDGHLTKPLDKKILLEEIEMFLLPSAARREGQEPSFNATPVKTYRTEASDPEFVNVQATLERVMDDRAFYMGLLEDFSASGDFENIERAWGEKKNSELLERIHALKGVSSNFGFDRLFDASQKLEDALLDSGSAAIEYDEFMRCFERTNENIAQLLEEWRSAK